MLNYESSSILEIINRETNCINFTLDIFPHSRTLPRERTKSIKYKSDCNTNIEECGISNFCDETEKCIDIALKTKLHVCVKSTNDGELWSKRYSEATERRRTPFTDSIRIM